MRKIFCSLTVALSFGGIIGCSQSPVGTKANPLKLMFIPYAESQTIATHTEKITGFLQKSLSRKMLNADEGFYVKASVPTSYVAVVEAFASKRADLSSMTTFAYLLAKDIRKAPVEAIVTVERIPDGSQYKAAIITRADSPIKTIQDLKGKRFAYADPASTSGFILPSKLFKDEKIELGETMFAGRHDIVVMMVLQKQVDAGAIFYSSPGLLEKNGVKTTEIRDARAMVLTQVPDVVKKTKIIGFTPAAPTEPFALRTNIYPEEERQQKLKSALVEALIAYAQSPEGKTHMQVLLRADKLVPTTDAAYNSLREMLSDLDIDPAKMVRK